MVEAPALIEMWHEDTKIAHWKNRGPALDGSGTTYLHQQFKLAHDGRTIAYISEIGTMDDERIQLLLDTPGVVSMRGPRSLRDDRPGVQYWVHEDGSLWKGYIPNDETMHWAKLNGWMTVAPFDPIWTLRSSSQPCGLTEVPFEQFEQLAEGLR